MAIIKIQGRRLVPFAEKASVPIGADPRVATSTATARDSEGDVTMTNMPSRQQMRSNHLSLMLKKGWGAADKSHTNNKYIPLLSYLIIGATITKRNGASINHTTQLTPVAEFNNNNNNNKYLE